MSAAAVSFAVNDRPGVSSGTRERILAAARELGWQPSASARALTEARTRAVGLVLARDAAQLEGDSFFVRFLSGIERALSAADYALLLQIVPGERRVGAARLRAPGGGGPRRRLPADRRRGRRPALRAAGGGRDAGRARGPAGGRRRPFPCVETRHDEGIAPAVEHLVALGHERIGFLGGRPEYEHVQAREARWRAALAPRSGPAGAGPVVARRPGDAAATAALALLRRRARPRSCARATRWRSRSIAAARSAGLSVPDDVSVVGFDDSALAAFAAPALTSIRIDYAEFGEAAALRAARLHRGRSGARVRAVRARARRAGLDR